MRIALVNDMVTALEAMRRVIVSTREHRIAWIAHDGAEALELCARDTPDLILMDLIMPRMDGVEATRRIMARTPCAIVVVTANVNGRSARVFEAMGVGALDAVNTPAGEGPGGRGAGGGGALLAKIETIHRLIGAGRRKSPPAGPEPFPRGAVPPAGPEPLPRGEGPEPLQRGVGPLASPPPLARHSVQHRSQLIVIGASAGGPTALAKVLAPLPADSPAPVVIVQHVDAQFVAGLASWLGSQTALRVRLAREGDRPEAGTALLAGGDSHLVFTGPTRLAYTDEPVNCFYCPSIDLFFNSADLYWSGDMIGVLLSGMGRDGAEGLRVLRARGHHTIAQDRFSSAAYGMPGAAAELHAASEILALDKIGPRLRNIVTQKIRAHG